MSNILLFKPGSGRKPRAKSRGLCQHGFHQWRLWQGQKFDVKQGRLVTVYRCSRCSAEKIKAL